MLDLFSIISRGGIVLWYFQRAADIHVSLPVNSLIKSVILQERSGQHIYEAHKLYFKLDNEFELIFVVGYQKMLQLSYIDKLLEQVMLSFRAQYKSQLLHNKLMSKFDFTNHFQDILKQCEDEVKASQEAPRKMMTFEQSNKSKKTVESLKKAENKLGSKAKPKKGTPVEQQADPAVATAVKEDVNHNLIPNGQDSSAELTDDMIKRNLENLKNKKNKANAPPTKAKENGKSKNKGKESRVWPYGGAKGSEKDLDYSKPRPVANGGEGNMTNGYHGGEFVNGEAGTTNSARVAVGSMRGQLKDLDTTQAEEYSSEEEEEENGQVGSDTAEVVPGGDTKRSQVSMKSVGGGLFGVFKGLVGSKTLNAETLEAPLEKMREHLIGKNVASEVADQLCNSVALKLQGKTVGSFSTIASSVRTAMEESLTTILSPKQRIDMLRDAQARSRGPNGRPYVVTFCGVNGVGKSTNLAKICFWLIENGLRVLIAGCDTFRAGAVEQLKTHCRALNALHPPDEKRGVMVQLYEKGYGKDAAAIAQEAINFAKTAKFDVVLVDTAGRMQDNEPLMRALAKLISVNSPDLVLFVGEALVGNEATDQLLKFNRALADHAPLHQSGGAGTHGGARTIDAIVLTKFDTIDDKVGACVSMTHSTGQPILFVGTGQTYNDLKVLNVTAVVNALLRS